MNLRVGERKKDEKKDKDRMLTAALNDNNHLSSPRYQLKTLIMF